MTQLRWMALGLALAAGVNPLPARAADTPKFTIQSAVAEALARNPQVLEAREKLNESRANVPYAVSQVFPSVLATAGAVYKKDSLLIGNPLFNGEPYNDYTLGLSVVQPLFRGGALWAGYREATREREVQALNERIAERDLSLQVFQAFYSVILGQRKLEATLQSRTVQQELLKEARARNRVGREQELNVLQTKTDLDLLEPKVLQAQNDVKLAAAQLATLLGHRDLPELEVSGSLEAPKWERLRARYEKQSYSPLELERQDTLIEQFGDKRTVELAPNWPSLNAIGEINTNATQKSQLFDENGRAWSVGVQLNIPIFSGLSSVFQRRALSAQGAQLDEQKAKLHNDLSLAQVQAQKALELSDDQLRAAQAALEDARHASKIARRTYPLGTTTYQQFFETQRSLLEAELSYSQLQYDYLVNVAKYFVASGWPLDELVATLGQGA